MAKATDFLQGTLDLLILRTLELEPLHGVGIVLAAMIAVAYLRLTSRHAAPRESIPRSRLGTSNRSQAEV